MRHEENFNIFTGIKHNKKSNSLSRLLISNTIPKKFDPKIGPGFYNVSLSTLSGPSFHFSSTTTFKHEEPLYLYHNYKKRDLIIKLPEVDLNTYKPSLK